MNLVFKMVVSFLAGLSWASLSAYAMVLPTYKHLPRQEQPFVATLADQSSLVAENRKLLVSNRALARKIATKLGITSTGEIPTDGTPLEQNQVMILQNQETFKAIAEKVGATIPTLAAEDATDPAEKNHKLLLQNKSIVASILKKLGKDSGSKC